MAAGVREPVVDRLLGRLERHAADPDDPDPREERDGQRLSVLGLSVGPPVRQAREVEVCFVGRERRARGPGLLPARRPVVVAWLRRAGVPIMTPPAGEGGNEVTLDPTPARGSAGHRRTVKIGDRDHGQAIDACEVVRIAGVQRQLVGDRDGRDHRVVRPGRGFPTGSPQ